MQNSSNDLFSRIFESSREFKKVTTITTCAMFGALAIVLGYYSFKITPNLKIGFSAIPNMLVDYLFGPVVGCLFGGAMDVIKFMLKPDGGFMPGFTFDAMLAAFLYGLFFYKKKLSLPRILTAKLVVIIICNIILATYWLTLLWKRFSRTSACPRDQKSDPMAGGFPDLLPCGENAGTGRSISSDPARGVPKKIAFLHRFTAIDAKTSLTFSIRQGGFFILLSSIQFSG